jgi:hypothetical protein
MIKLKSLLLTEDNINAFLETLEIESLSSGDIDNIKNLGGKNIPFEIDGKKYKLEINLSLFNNDKIAEVKFYLLNNPKSPNKQHFKNDTQYQLALKKSQLGITGTGNPFKILTKVLSLLNYYIKDENDIKYLTFVADEENRQRLYKSILQKIIKKYNIPYKQCNKNPMTGDVLNPEEFWLEKKYD